MTDLLVPAAKVAIMTLLSGIGALWAQTNIPLDGFGTIGLVGLLAIILGRYTFRQLEDYRKDITAGRERIDELQDELHEQGRSKAATEKRNRELEEYAHRLHLWVLAAGIGDSDVPPPPSPGQS